MAVPVESPARGNVLIVACGSRPPRDRIMITMFIFHLDPFATEPKHLPLSVSGVPPGLCFRSATKLDADFRTVSRGSAPVVIRFGHGLPSDFRPMLNWEIDGASAACLLGGAVAYRKGPMGKARI